MSLKNFLDPTLNPDGTPYAPKRFKDIVYERYFISSQCNTSYNDVGRMTPLERKYVTEFIIEKLEKEQKALEDAQKKKKNNHTPINLRR